MYLDSSPRSRRGRGQRINYDPKIFELNIEDTDIDLYFEFLGFVLLRILWPLILGDGDEFLLLVSGYIQGLDRDVSRDIVAPFF